MNRKTVKVGYRVAPLYRDEPNGTITKLVNAGDVYVMVLWDKTTEAIREPVKFLRKGK